MKIRNNNNISSFNQGILADDGKYSIGMRDKNAQHHWREISGKLPPTTKKRIFIFPGSATNSARGANGMCKTFTAMLGEDLADKCEIYAMHWPNSKIYNESIAMRAMHFFDNYVMPLISQEDEEGKIKPLPAQKAAENLRNVVWGTHCYGGYITATLNKELEKTLQNLGYTPQEQEHIQRQLVIVHHNNINAEIGRNSIKTTNIYRSSQKDEENDAGDFKLGTIQHYIQSTSLSENDVLYAPISPNERLIILKQITSNGRDHNGGYWIDSSRKTKAGQDEEQIFGALLREIVSTRDPIHNPEQFMQRIIQKNDEVGKLADTALQEGRQYGGSLQFERTFTQKEYAIFSDKIKKRNMDMSDISRVPENILFAMDEQENFLLDIALEQKNYELAGALYKAMDAKIPPKGNFGFVLYKSANHQQFAQARERYLQIALNEEQPDFFKDCVSTQTDLTKLDYILASDKMIVAVAGHYIQQPVGKAWNDKEKHLKKLIYMTARCEKMEQTPEISELLSQMNEQIFTQGNTSFALQRSIKGFSAEYGASKLFSAAVKRWKDKPIVKNDSIKLR